MVSALSTAGIRVSLFIEPDPAQIDAAIRLKAPVVEFHTGRYAHLDGAERNAELRRLSDAAALAAKNGIERSEDHTSELQSLMRISYAFFCLNKKTKLLPYNTDITLNHNYHICTHIYTPNSYTSHTINRNIYY